MSGSGSKDHESRRNSTKTIRDIAKEAGVSPGTVSRVFHSPNMVKSSTRIKIESVIKKYNYIPNLYASALTTKQTMTIGLIIPTVKNSIHASLIESIQEECHQEGYSVLIGNTNYTCDTELKLLEIMLRRRVSGIIHAGSLHPDSLKMLRNAAEHQIPSIVVWENLADAEISSIGVSNFDAGYRITKYLIDHGHRNLGILVGPYDQMTRLNERKKGFQTCLEDHSLPFNPQAVIKLTHKIQDGATGLHKLINTVADTTAVFAASDVLAFGALTQARKEGIQVPQELSIVGFDDIEFATYTVPALTTIRVPGVEMGRKAVSELIDRIINKRVSARHICLPTEIIERESVRYI